MMLGAEVAAKHLEGGNVQKARDTIQQMLIDAQEEDASETGILRRLGRPWIMLIGLKTGRQAAATLSERH